MILALVPKGPWGRTMYVLPVHYVTVSDGTIYMGNPHLTFNRDEAADFSETEIDPVIARLVAAGVTKMREIRRES